MVKVPPNLNIGDKEDMTTDKLVDIVEQMYVDLAQAINGKPDIYERTTDGQTGDTFLPNGSININTSTDKVEMLTNHVDSTTVTWTELS